MLWHNLSLCHIQKEDYEAAKEDLGTLLTIAPRYTRAYLMPVSYTHLDVYKRQVSDT